MSTMGAAGLSYNSVTLAREESRNSHLTLYHEYTCYTASEAKCFAAEKP